MGRVSPDNEREKESQTREDAPSRDESRVEIKARGQTVDDERVATTRPTPLNYESFSNETTLPPSLSLARSLAHSLSLSLAPP